MKERHERLKKGAPGGHARLVGGARTPRRGGAYN
jgi:hypothetical protein